MSTKKHNGHEDGHKCAAFLIRDKKCYDTSTISVLSLQNTPATFFVEFLVKDGSDNRKDQAKYQRPPEPCNRDAIYKATRQHHDQCIDDEQEQTESKNCNRECKKNDEWLHENVEDCQDNGKYQGRPESVYVNALQDMRKAE